MKKICNRMAILFFLMASSVFAVEGLREIEMIGLETIGESGEMEEQTEEEVFPTVFNKGNHLFKEKQYEKANQVFKSDFSDIKNIFGAATTDRFLGRYELAIQEYGQVLSQNGEFAEAYLGRALAYRNSGRYEEAIGDFKRYLSLYQGEAGYIGLGDTYMATGRYSEAQAILSQGIAKHPTSSVMRKMLSQAYLKTK